MLVHRKLENHFLWHRSGITSVRDFHCGAFQSDIMRRFKIKDSEEVESIKSFERVNESLQESFFKELGVNVLWIDEFSEIPILLKQIKGNYDSY